MTHVNMHIKFWTGLINWFGLFYASVCSAYVPVLITPFGSWKADI